MKKHQKLDLVKKFRPSETISRQNIASKIESLSDRRGRKIKKKRRKCQYSVFACEMEVLTRKKTKLQFFVAVYLFMGSNMKTIRI